MFDAQLLLWARPEPGWQQFAALLGQRGYRVSGPCESLGAEWPLDTVARADIVLLDSALVSAETEPNLPVPCLRLALANAVADPVAVFVQIEMVLQVRPADFTAGIEALGVNLLESEIQDSEKRYRIVAEQTGQMIYDWDVSSGEIEWVGAIERITGFDSAAYQAVNIEVWESMIHPAERASTVAVLDHAAKTDGHFSMEYRLQCKDGSFVWVEDTGLFLMDATGRVVRMLGSMKDISRRRINAELLQSAFNEREILLQEIHHRVKNNFQIMISLLNMQIRRTPFLQVGESLKDVRSRLHSMLLVHEKLYNQGVSATVHFGEYLQVLSHELYAQHAGAVPVQLELALQPLVLRMDQAMPCGLIANELLTNAFKYAFPETGEQDCITLRLVAEAGQAQLDIVDNGQGFPAEFRQGLGLHLVDRLARQLDGACAQLERSQGTHWVLRFPLVAVSG